MRKIEETHFIRIRSEITQDDETPEKIELMTNGSFIYKNGNYYISYVDTQNTGHEGSSTTIKVAEDQSQVALLRYGKHAGQLHIQRGKRSVCHYETELGSLTLGVTADQIISTLTSDGGNVKFSYLLDTGSSLPLSKNQLDITVSAFSS